MNSELIVKDVEFHGDMFLHLTAIGKAKAMQRFALPVLHRLVREILFSG